MERSDAYTSWRSGELFDAFFIKSLLLEVSTNSHMTDARRYAKHMISLFLIGTKQTEVTVEYSRS